MAILNVYVLNDLNQLCDSFHHLPILSQVTKEWSLGKHGFPLENQPHKVRDVLFKKKKKSC